VTNTKSMALLGGEEGVHLILANLPRHQLYERAEKIPGELECRYFFESSPLKRLSTSSRLSGFPASFNTIE
jgi:hypothetical protein